HGPSFGDAVNQALVCPTEFETLQREYPIFLRRDANAALQAVVLLGLDRDENLFLDGERWNARYVPAIHRRGPFSIALEARPGDAPAPMIHIDLDHPRVSRTEGEPLFLPAGGATPYLQDLNRALGAIWDGLEAGKAMFAILDERALIEPVAVEVRLDDATQYDLPDLFTINQERLDQLSGQELEAMHRSGFLRLAYAISASLANVSHLIELKNARRAARAA
ncbi:MAG: SapC family protein, partial [Caulobacter sp.]